MRKNGYDTMSLKLTCRVMVVMKKLSYATLLRLIRHMSDRTNLNLNEWHHDGSPRKTVRHIPTNVEVMVFLVYGCDDVILTHTVTQNRLLMQSISVILSISRDYRCEGSGYTFCKTHPSLLQDNARTYMGHHAADLYRR